ncbi:MAG: PSD1 domain-containing protein [Verrucomicrobiae bacterium]|nr:PSD1 domain-containing protein [Verrucomicrobiae bacterium]
MGFALALPVLTVPTAFAARPELDLASLPPPASHAVDFRRDIEPIFSAHCLDCHGPDRQRGGFRLDRRADALRGGDFHAPDIIPGDSAASPLIHLVGGLIPDEFMPVRGDPLTPEQIGLLRAWIDQGAPWPDDGSASQPDPTETHWAFQPVVRPAVPDAPTASDPGWGHHAIDRFIADRLAREGLHPAAPADRHTLIRRLSFDLIGLPPSPEEVEAFVQDPDPDAYDRLVERLLASPRFGERWARHWLDVVRFAETHGFEMNNPRPNAWHYRDYVIRAFNSDLPYDQFILEQIAGDALGVEEATGFLVAGPWDQVKSPDEVLTRNQRADELHDILNTTGTAFLGLTVGCARCHDHKFDPITQLDYFSLKALLAGTEHGERPLAAPGDRTATAQRLEALTAERLDLDRRLEALEPVALVAAADEDVPAIPPRRDPVHTGRNIDRFEPVHARFLRFTILATSGGEPCIDEFEVFTAGPGPVNVARATHGTRVEASGTYPNSAIHRLEHIHDGKYGNDRSWISNEAGRGWLRFQFPRIERIDRVVWSRDRSPKPVYADRLVTRYRLEVSLDGESWTLLATDADRLERGARPDSSLLAADPAESERDRLRQRRAVITTEMAELDRRPMVYAGVFKEPEPTRRFHRGDPMQPRETVDPGVLQFTAFRPDLADIPAERPERERRLALARWIASPDHPLTARVIVNRLWHYHFGEGLVPTPSDFGLNGAPPSHPELLDWLASELLEPTAGAASPWSLKHLHRLMVTSAAYRQSSRATDASPLAADRDAGNRWLWKFPSRRLDAEPLRDAFLSVAGRLDLRMGGPGWSPFEPNDNYVRVYVPKQTFGPDDFRRMVYATVVRQRPDGVFGAFDCPDGGQIAPKRSRSITPLQALNLLNSGFALQTAGFFADRLQRELGDDAEAQVHRAFALAFQRPPDPEELSASLRLIESHGLPLFCRALLNANEFVFVF